MQIDNHLFTELDILLEKFNFKLIDSKFKRMNYSIYSDGNLYQKGETEPFFSSYDSPSLYKDTAIVSNEHETVKELAVSLISSMYATYLTNEYKMIIPNYLNLVESNHNFLQVNYYLYEIKLLKMADKVADLNIKKAFLRLFINVRHQRSKMDGGFTLDEMKAEQFNGLLAYARIGILKQIYSPKSIQIKEYLDKINHTFDQFFNTMNGSFLTGYYLKNILLSLGYDVPSDKFMYNIAISNIDYVSEIVTLPKNNKAIKLIKYRESQSRDVLNYFFSLEPKKIKYSGKVKTFDPASVIKFDSKYYFDNFVVLEDENGVSKYLTGPIVVGYENKKVTFYYKLK